MLSPASIKQMFTGAGAAGLVYSAAVWAYIRHMSFDETWVLYVGNFLFAAVIAAFLAWYYHRHEGEVSTIKLVVVGGKTAVAGIGFACLLSLVLLLIFIPAIFRPVSVSHIELQGSPAQFSGKNQGFAFILFLNAILGNAGASFFISLLLPFTIMKNQYSGKGR